MPSGFPKSCINYPWAQKPRITISAADKPTFDNFEEPRKLVIEKELSGLLAQQVGFFGSFIVRFKLGDGREFVHKRLHSDAFLYNLAKSGSAKE